MTEKFFRKEPVPTQRENVTADAEIILDSRDESKRFRMEDFADTYDDENRHGDKAKVEQIKKHFAEALTNLTDEQLKKVHEGKKISEALEAIIIDFGELLKWFGDRAKLTQTEEFDDLANGVDGVVEFDLPAERPYRMALVIDASMKPVFASLEKKLNRNIEKIVGNTQQAEVKYFASKVDNYKGKLNLVVPTVIGIEGDNANELIKLFSEIIQLQKKPNKNYLDKEELVEKMREAENHPAQIVFLREIQEQLSMYVHLIDKELQARSMTKREQEVKNIYRAEIIRFAGIITDILDQKKTLTEGNLKNDGVHKTIRKVVDEKMR